MSAASSAAGATLQPVARILFIISSVQIMITSCQSDRFNGPLVGKILNEQCPYVEFVKVRSVSECLDRCLSHSGPPACTAINYSVLYKNCWLVACTLPVPPPAWDYDGWNAYSLKPDNSLIEDECQKNGGEIFDDRCYLLSEDGDLKNYTDAMHACIAKQGELAMFPDFPGIGIQLVHHRDTGDPRYWVGGRNKDTEGGWQWENGVPITWPYNTYPWGHGEPNGLDHENCLDILTTGDHHGYNDEHCDNKHQYICELGCVFAGTIYPPGSFIHEACIQLQCNGATGLFVPNGYDDSCPKCTISGDPHITTYDGKYYNYQNCGNYSITQIGNSVKPPHAVFAYFANCTKYGPSVTCIEKMTFKNDNHTFITIGYEEPNNLWMQVNDKDFNLKELSSSPSIIKVDNTDYPVLGWITQYSNTANEHKANCVQLQGSSGIMVKLCKGSGNANTVYVWASPDIGKELKGLCGTPNGNYSDELTTRREGISKVVDAFGLSWIADTNDGSCNTHRMQTENNCESNVSLPIIFRSQCEDAVLNEIFTPETNQSQILIDSCVYDLCGAIDPVEGIELVHQAMSIHTHIKKNTVGHCEHKRTHKCKTHNGTCILKTETCDGTIIDRGCHGRKCECCAPSGCEQSPKCHKKQGKCLLLKDAMDCEGIVNSELCEGNKCACCYPKAPNKCGESKKCSKVNGQCIEKKKWEDCKDKLKKKWCDGNKCGCCYQ